MSITQDKGDTDFLSEMHRLGPQTVTELGKALGVTATAVRQRLVRLQAGEFVARKMVRTARGRPHFMYEVTAKGLRELGENYSDLALILWREVHRIPDPVLRQSITDRVRDALVQRYGRPEGDLSDRVRQLCTTLAANGFDVEATTSEFASSFGPVRRGNSDARTSPGATASSKFVPNGVGHPEAAVAEMMADEPPRFNREPLAILRERSCPYPDLADQDRGICTLEREVFQRVLGADVVLSQCHLDGHGCCEFEIRERQPAAPA